MNNCGGVLDINVVRIIASTFKNTKTQEEIIADAAAFMQMCFILGNELREANDSLSVLSNEYVNALASISLIHDIGKVGIPKRILNKPGPLTDAEMDIVKKHPEIGRCMIRSHMKERDSLSRRLAAEVTLYHHEKWDGSGYPNKMKGEAIPLSARIVAVVDVYHALRSNRCYKKAYSHEKSKEIICKGSGTHFDPLVVASFLNVAEKFDDIFEGNQDACANQIAFV